MAKLFGTDGIRGRANQYPLDPQTALTVGRSVASLFHRDHVHPKIVVGRDTRLSGGMLEGALIAGITSAGVDVVLLGVVPTAFVSHLTSSLSAIAGIMISASHNSFEDNGIKIFQSTGYKCDDALEAQIERAILDPATRSEAPSGASLGKVISYPTSMTCYRDFILRSWPQELNLREMRIAVDTANGSACETAPEILRHLGADLFLFHHEPNGVNINLDCGSTHPGFIQRETELCGAQVGFAFDGDADRLICCDEQGTIVDGDEIMAILALDYLRSGKLAQNTLVATTQSNLGLDECLAAAGGTVIRTDVGDRHVLAVLEAQNLTFGGEQSGHMILRHLLPTSDGLLTALELLRIMRQTGQPLSQLRQVLRKYPQILLNQSVEQKKPLAELPRLTAVLEEARETLGRQGRINFRYSGTENKARLLLEGSDEGQLRLLGDHIIATLCSETAPTPLSAKAG